MKSDSQLMELCFGGGNVDDTINKDHYDNVDKIM